MNQYKQKMTKILKMRFKNNKIMSTALLQFMVKIKADFLVYETQNIS